MLALSEEMQAKLEEHLEAAARIMYEHTEAEKLESFESIEWEVRGQILEKVSPKIGEFFCQREDKREEGNKEG